MPREGVKEITIKVPQFNSLVATPRCQSFAIWAKADAIDPIVMPSEGLEEFALKAPEIDSLIPTGRGKDLAI
jgi:hypothetical protein